MSSLAVYRGDTFDRKVVLGQVDLRVGRAPENDLVLPDPEKGVSRFHAEIRCEQDRYVVVDLNSQNGVWVEDRRVGREVLRPGVPVTVGPYRLVLEASETAVVAAPERHEEPTYAPTHSLYLDQQRPQPAPAPASDSNVQPGTNPHITGAPASSASTSATQPAAPSSRGKGLWIGVAGAAVIVIVALVAFGRWSTPLDDPEQTTIAETPATPPAPAATPPAEPPAPAEPTKEEQIAGHWKAANDLYAQQDLPGALSALEQLLALQADHVEALGLKARIEKEAAAAAAAATPAAAVVKCPDSMPNIPRRARESDEAFVRRCRQLHTEYLKGVSAQSTGNYADAVQAFERVLAEQSVGYLDATARRDESRRNREAQERRQSAQACKDQAEQFEKANNLRDAFKKYECAAEWQADLPGLSASLARVRQQLDRIVDERWREARNRHANARTAATIDAAIKAYQAVLEAAPESHPRFQEATKAIEELRKGK